MAIEYVRKKSDAEKPVGARNNTAERTFREKYTIKSTVTDEKRSVLLGALPQYGSPHPEDSQAVVVKVYPKRLTDAPNFWEADVEWSTDTSSGSNPSDSQKQPDERRPKWKFRFQPIDMGFDKDLDGKPFVDRAGSPFDPPPNIPIWVDEVTITRYEARIDRNFDRRYLNATNTDTWLGAEPSTAKIVSNDAEEVFLCGSYWFARTFVILVNPRIVIETGSGSLDNSHNTEEKYTPDTLDVIVGGWYPTYHLNMGPRQLEKKTVQGKTTYEAVPIKQGEYVDGQPHELDGEGKVIVRNPDGTWPKPLVYLGFRTVNRREFKPLRLIPPWL